MLLPAWRSIFSLSTGSDKMFFLRMTNHLKRFKDAFLYSIITLTSLVASYGYFYPGDENIGAYIGMMDGTLFLSLIPGLDVASPGYVFWISMSIGLYLYYTVAVASIRMGSRILPTTDEDGVEMLLGGMPINPRQFYIENLLAAILILFLSIIPSAAILTAYASYQHDTDIGGRIISTHLFIFVIGLVLLSISSFIAIQFFSRSLANKVGVVYLIYAAFLEMSVQSGQAPQESGNISLMYYAQPSAGLLTGEYNWEPIYVLLAVFLVFVALSLWILKSREYIQKSPKTGSKRWRPSDLLSPENKLAKKYPVIFEQIRSDIGSLLGWMLVTISLIFYFPSLTPTEDDFEQIMGSFEMPMMQAFSGGHPYQYDFTGFMAIEFFSLPWFYWGFFVVFSAASIATKEVRINNQDVVWALQLSRSSIILQRTAVLLLETSLFIWISYLSILAIIATSPFTMDQMLVLQAFLVLWLQWLAIVFILVGISMSGTVSRGRSRSIQIFLVWAVCLILGYTADALSWMKFLSIYHYMDVIGILFEVAEFGTELLIALSFLLASVIFFIIVLKQKFESSDLI
ncbi:MAG: hypothetical protein INQ03_21505 [Candidatus Heimdallarchaeota archaeon]|nr:hypothetical protein [Candidatus Heimdallarchaeota archaeon]